MRRLGLFLAAIAMSISLGAQDSSTQLLEEDSYARVTRYTSDSSVTVPLKMDSVVVPLAGSDVSFQKRGTAFHFDNQNQGVLLVELKKHWDAEIKPCSAPMTCVRPIKAMGHEIGETRSIFSNGFISAYAHRMEHGGTLTSSYYTSKGSDHIILIALTPLHVNFSGTEEDMKAGAAYSSDATEVEVTAGEHDVRWVVIRVHK